MGIDIRTFLASLERSGACAYPAGNLEELSRAVQLRHRLPEYHPPILVGYSSGATLVYAVLAQAPPETFRGAISLGFCPDVSLHTPLCRGRGLVSRPMAKGTGRDLDPFKEMGVPWTVLHGDIDQVCAPAMAADFVGRVDSGAHRVAAQGRSRLLRDAALGAAVRRGLPPDRSGGATVAARSPRGRRRGAGRRPGPARTRRGARHRTRARRDGGRAHRRRWLGRDRQARRRPPRGRRASRSWAGAA